MSCQICALPCHKLRDVGGVKYYVATSEHPTTQLGSQSTDEFPLALSDYAICLSVWLSVCLMPIAQNRAFLGWGYCGTLIGSRMLEV